MAQYNNITRIGVISDTHIPSRAKSLPAKVHEVFSGVNLIIHAGDMVSDEALLELEAIAPVAAVRGNMDHGGMNLPDELILNINGNYTICVAHGGGSPFDIRNRLWKRFYEKKPDMIIYGHTHAADDRVENGIRFFNPGSPTSGNSKDTVAIININETGLNVEFIEI